LGEVIHEWAVDIPLGHDPEETALNKSLPHSLSDMDPRLLTEAFRRARARQSNAGLDADGLLSAIIAEARRGTRDLYGLSRAAEVAALTPSLDDRNRSSPHVKARSAPALVRGTSATSRAL
jgi:hypothetical protein